MNRPVPADIETKLITNLRQKGYELTSQRLEIVKLSSQDRSHPGAMDILRKVKKRLTRIGMSTVYYTLDMLKRGGLIYGSFNSTTQIIDTRLTYRITLISFVGNAER